MRIQRDRLQTAATGVIGGSFVVVGAAFPHLALPLVGAGTAMLLGMSTARRAALGWTLAVVAAGVSLPVAVTALQRAATVVFLGWTIVGTVGWRRALGARRSAEAAIDTIILSVQDTAGKADAPQVLRALADILGATSGRFEHDAPHAASASWDKKTKTVLVPLHAAGRRAGCVALRGVVRPAPWKLTLADLVASRWAEQALEQETADRLRHPEAIDPITGLGNEHAVAAGLASLSPGDSVIALRLEDVARTRVAEGEARADLLLCQLGLHVRNRLRGTDVVARYGDDRFVVICRNPKGETPAIIDRLLSAWPVWEAGHRILAISAVHDETRSPLDTLEAAVDPLGHTTLDLEDGPVRILDLSADATDLKVIVGS